MVTTIRCAALVFIILLIAISCSNQVKEGEKPRALEQPVERRNYSSLELTDIYVAKSKVVISGETDLPDGATLMVGLDVWGRSGSDLYIGVDDKTTILQGKFTIELTPPQREEFKKGPYEISVLFTPRRQPESVLKLVGKDGENLSGDFVDESGSFKTMHLIEKKELQLFITIPSYKFQQPSEFQRGTAKRALAEYASAWKNQDWYKMTKFAQKTWLSTQEDPVEMLEAWYSFKTLNGFEIIDVKKITDVTIDLTFIVQYEAFTNQISKKKITARIIKETAPYTPSEEGQWGVNPSSTLTEEDVG